MLQANAKLLSMLRWISDFYGELVDPPSQLATSRAGTKEVCQCLSSQNLSITSNITQTAKNKILGTLASRQTAAPRVHSDQLARESDPDSLPPNPTSVLRLPIQLKLIAAGLTLFLVKVLRCHQHPRRNTVLANPCSGPAGISQCRERTFYSSFLGQQHATDQTQSSIQGSAVTGARCTSHLHAPTLRTACTCSTSPAFPVYAVALLPAPSPSLSLVTSTSSTYPSPSLSTSPSPAISHGLALCLSLHSSCAIAAFAVSPPCPSLSPWAERGVESGRNSCWSTGREEAEQERRFAWQLANTQIFLDRNVLEARRTASSERRQVGVEEDNS